MGADSFWVSPYFFFIFQTTLISRFMFVIVISARLCFSYTVLLDKEAEEFLYESKYRTHARTERERESELFIVFFLCNGTWNKIASLFAS